MAHNTFGREPLTNSGRCVPLPRTARKHLPESLRHNELGGQAFRG